MMAIKRLWLKASSKRLASNPNDWTQHSQVHAHLEYIFRWGVLLDEEIHGKLDMTIQFKGKSCYVFHFKPDNKKHPYLHLEKLKA